MEVCMEKGGSVNGVVKKKNEAPGHPFRSKVKTNNINELLNQTGIDPTQTETDTQKIEINKFQAVPGNNKTVLEKPATATGKSKIQNNNFPTDTE